MDGSLKKIIAWYRFASSTWLSLTFGWCSILISLTPYLRLDRAGAFLVCGAIVAEVFHDKSYRRFIEQTLPGMSKTYTYTVIDVPKENKKDIEVREHQMRMGNVIINSEPWSLFHLANKKEFYVSAGEKKWSINATMNRADKTIDFIIALSAIAGTILWAYGN
jgi:hypothetical protein